MKKTGCIDNQTEYYLPNTDYLNFVKLLRMQLQIYFGPCGFGGIFKLSAGKCAFNVSI